MLKTIKERTFDNFIRKLNGHWYTQMIRASKPRTRLPQSSLVNYKDGLVFNDYAGQNTPLDSFKSLFELDMHKRRRAYADELKQRVYKAINTNYKK